MTVKTGQAWAGLFVTLDATGAKAAATGTPVGALYVDGVADAATVTITGSNPYKWSVTLPTLTAGQRVDMYITATISTIATAGIVASAQADTALLSDGVVVNGGTVTNLTNLPTMPNDWVTAAGLKADAVTEIQNGLATTAHVQEVENKVDLIDVTTVANSGKIDAVDTKVSAIDTDTVMSFMIDGFTFEQIVQIMASVLAGKLTRAGDTLSFRDLADTVNRVVAETDANKQRTDMTYTV